jgi:hypothetical protein
MLQPVAGRVWQCITKIISGHRGANTTEEHYTRCTETQALRPYLAPTVSRVVPQSGREIPLHIRIRVQDARYVLRKPSRQLISIYLHYRYLEQQDKSCDQQSGHIKFPSRSCFMPSLCCPQHVLVERRGSTAADTRSDRR